MKKKQRVLKRIGDEISKIMQLFVWSFIFWTRDVYQIK